MATTARTALRFCSRASSRRSSSIRYSAAIISRIKIMAGLNIAEKRLPQDGRMDIRIGDQEVDVRVSTLPTAFGERVVLRLLDKSSVLLKLTDLGMTPERLKLLNGPAPSSG